MGFIANAIGGLFGGSDKGSNYQALQSDIWNPASQAQATQAGNQVQSGLNQQQDFVNAINAQGGLQNQANVINQLQGVAAGTGPNPAQAMLAQQTGSNIAAQNALMAGQRGASANVGLMARQAAMQGGALQQQSVGQGATMQANQSLNALGQLGNLTSQQVAQQQGALNALNQGAQGNQQNIYNAIAQANNARVQSADSQNRANSAVAAQNAKQQNSAVGGLFGGAASALTGGLFAEGGEVPGLNVPIMMPTVATPPFVPPVAAPNTSGPKSKFGSFLKTAFSEPTDSIAESQDPLFAQGNQLGQNLGNALVNLFKPAAGGAAPQAPGTAPNLGVDVSMPKVDNKEMLAKGGNVGHKLKKGGHVPGKAKVKGDNLQNDTVDAKLSPGEIVLPRSVTQGQDPVNDAAKFVAAIMAKKGRLK